MQLSHLIGSERLKLALAPFFKRNFPQAVIIEGDFGTGKKTAAFDIACALFCEQEDIVCGKCGACRRMNAGSMPDYTVFNEAGEAIKVDLVRDIRRQSFIRPSEAEQKVFVINRADLMNVAAQNALLKVLEEPQSTTFLLLCENDKLLLQTVRSRCMVFSTSALADEQIAGELSKKYKAFTKEQINTAVASSRGSLGRALQTIEGKASKAAELAEEFMQSAETSEMKAFETCLKIGALPRIDFLEFCDDVCLLLCDTAKKKPECQYALPMYNYICDCARRIYINNASTSLTAAAIAVKLEASAQRRNL